MTPQNQNDIFKLAKHLPEKAQRMIHTAIEEFTKKELSLDETVDIIVSIFDIYQK